jgi:hypothetical protein
VLKTGWFIGGAGGSAVLTFHGRRYPVSIGGLKAGLVFGASDTHLSAPSPTLLTHRTYMAAGAGAALRVGASTIVLKNEKGAVLSLNGRMVERSD